MIQIEQLQRDIDGLPEEAQDLLVDFIELLKRRFPQPTPAVEVEAKSHYDRFAEIGLIGCCAVEEDLSVNYKTVLTEHLNSGRIFSVDQRDFNAYRWKQTLPFENLLDVDHGSGHESGI